MNQQETYWDQRIREWTRASYRQKSGQVSLVEKVAGLFRSGIEGRMKVALEVIGPLSKGKVLADMGCGLGDFCFQALKYQPKKVVGIDISAVAIKQAEKIAKQKKTTNKVKFVQGNLLTLKTWPKFDIAVGLGFIDYFNEEELRDFFDRFKDQKFFFSFFEKKLSLINLIHPIYVKLQKCPGSYKYTRQEIRNIIPKKIKFDFLEKDGLLFVTNLPL
jgi:SAM-dependent methyltransferase